MNRSPSSGRRLRTSVKILLIYLALGSIWILLSDRLARLIDIDYGTVMTIYTLRSFAFLVLTAWAFYALIDRFQQSEERYRNLVELSPEPIIVYRQKGITFVNPAGIRLFGATHINELVGRKILDFFPSDYVELVKMRIKQVEENRIPTELAELKFLRLDGHTVDVETTAVPTTYLGKPAVQLLMRDISKRKQSEAKYRLIAENMSDLIGVLDAEGTMLYASPSILTLLGRPPEARLGRSVFEFIHPDDVERVKQSFSEMISTEQPSQAEFRYRTIDNGWITLEVKAKPVIGAGGALDSIVFAARDVTQRLRFENELIRAKEQLQNILDSHDISVWSYDFHSIDVGLISLGNEKMWGIPLDELFRAPDRFYPMIHPDDVSAVRNNINLLRRGSPVLFDFRLNHSNGTTRWIHLRIVPITDRSGSIIRMHGVAIDITDLKQSEEERRRSEELLRMSDRLSAVGQLAAGLAHEVRNPLTAIKGFVQLLESQMEGYDKYFEIILSELSRINSIVSEFMVLSKPHAVAFRSKNIREILDDTVALIQAQATLNDVQMTLEYVSAMPPVNCDENQLKQLFINILKNAMEAIPSGGQVTIQAGMLSEGALFIKISDNGCGIPQELMDKIGEPFFTTKDAGTGLGLMVCYKIVENHRGKIHVESEINKGTTITLVFPVELE